MIINVCQNRIVGCLSLLLYSNVSGVVPQVWCISVFSVKCNGCEIINLVEFYV